MFPSRPDRSIAIAAKQPEKQISPWATQKQVVVCADLMGDLRAQSPLRFPLTGFYPVPAAVLIKILHSVGSVLCPGQVQHLASANMWPSQSIPCLWFAGWKQTRHRPKPLLAPTIGPPCHVTWCSTLCANNSMSKHNLPQIVSLRCGKPSNVKTSYSRTSISK